MLTEHAQRIVLEVGAGDSYAEVGRRHSISKQRVHTLVREATQHVDHLELELLRARVEGEVRGLVIPYQAQGDRQTALAYFDWIVTRLRDRGAEVKVERRGTEEGEVFFLEDITTYGGKVS